MMMDKIRTVCPNLPTGWIKEVVVRKSGASAGKSDVYYYSPEGKKCRSKPQMLQYLPDDFDLDSFDFRVGKRDETASKRKRRRHDFNYGKDFNIPQTFSRASRKPRKMQEPLKVNVINNSEVDLERSGTVDTKPTKLFGRGADAGNDAKKRRAENLSLRYTKPRQLFWQRRLQNLLPTNERTMEPCRQVKLEASAIKDLLPGSNSQALINSLSYAIHSNTKIVGQHASLNVLRKHPTALCNTEQPFTASISITEEMLRAQEKRVECTRKKLCEAQDLLRELEDEDEDLDDMEE